MRGIARDLGTYESSDTSSDQENQNAYENFEASLLKTSPCLELASLREPAEGFLFSTGQLDIFNEMETARAFFPSRSKFSRFEDLHPIIEGPDSTQEVLMPTVVLLLVIGEGLEKTVRYLPEGLFVHAKGFPIALGEFLLPFRFGAALLLKKSLKKPLDVAVSLAHDAPR